MKLYEVPNHTRIKIAEAATKVPPGGMELPVGTEMHFSSIDGMYSFCVTDDGEVVHPAAWTEVEIVEVEE